MHSVEEFYFDADGFAQSELPSLDGIIDRRNRGLLQHLSVVLPGVQQFEYSREDDSLRISLVLDRAVAGGLDAQKTDQLAKRFALMFDSDLKLSITDSLDNRLFVSSAKRQARLLAPIPADLQERYQIGDSREIGLLINELLAAPYEACGQMQEDWLEPLSEVLAAEIFKAPRIHLRSGLLELELDNRYEELLETPLQQALGQLLDILPQDYTAVVLTQRSSEKRIVEQLDPINNVGAQDEVSRAMRRNSAEALLSESLPFSRVSILGDGLVVATNFDLLPDWTKQRLITRLQQFGVTVRLEHEALEPDHSEDLLAQIGRCLRFCLPKSLWLQRIDETSSGIAVRLCGESSEAQELEQLERLVQGVWRLSAKFTVDPLDPQAVDQLSGLGRRHAAALARLSDGDGVIRAQIKEAVDIISFELVRDVPDGTYRLPSEAIERGYPKVTQQFIAIGRPGSLQEDAFHIVADKTGYELTIAIADASWLAPQESYIGHEMMAHGYSVYDRNVQIPSIPWQILNSYGGFSTNAYRPAVLVNMTIDHHGVVRGTPIISLGSIKLSREMSPRQFRELADARSNDDRFPVVNFDNLTNLLSKRRIADGGLVWFDEERNVDEVQVLVNQILPAFALSNGLAQLVRAHAAPTLETRRSYIDRLLNSFHELDVTRFACSDEVLLDDRAFRRRLHAILSSLEDDSRREAFRLLRLSTRYSATPGETNFFQQGKVYAQYSGTYRRLAAKINLEQISRYLRGEPVRDQAEMDRFEEHCRLLEYSMRNIGDTLRVADRIGYGMSVNLINGRFGYRAALTPDLVAQFDSESQAKLTAAGRRAGDSVEVRVVGYDLKLMRAVISLA